MNVPRYECQLVVDRSSYIYISFAILFQGVKIREVAGLDGTSNEIRQSIATRRDE